MEERYLSLSRYVVTFGRVRKSREQLRREQLCTATRVHIIGANNIVVQTMEQFRSFKKYINKIDKYGMKSGIVKVIPPKEW